MLYFSGDGARPDKSWVLRRYFGPPGIERLYVDSGNQSGTEDGSAQHPFRTARQAIGAAGPGTTISIQTGDYAEAPLTFCKPGRIVATGGTVALH
jgi:hypothetical protein